MTLQEQFTAYACKTQRRVLGQVLRPIPRYVYPYLAQLAQNDNLPEGGAA